MPRENTMPIISEKQPKKKINTFLHENSLLAVPCASTVARKVIKKNNAQLERVHSMKPFDHDETEVKRLDPTNYNLHLLMKAINRELNMTESQKREMKQIMNTKAVLNDRLNPEKSFSPD